MRWFWDPGNLMGRMPGVTQLPPRRLNLTELDQLGKDMARAVSAPTYELIGGYDNRPIKLEDLATMVPSMLMCTMLATAPEADRAQRNESPGQESKIQLTLLPAGYCSISSVGIGKMAEPGIAARYSELGKPRRNREWVFPAAFLLAVALAVAPLVVLWARRELTLWLIPFVVGAVLLAFVVGGLHVRQAVEKERLRTSGLQFDLRPIEQVRLHQEEKRQRRQVALIWGTVAAVLGAAVGAILSKVLG